MSHENRGYQRFLLCVAGYQIEKRRRTVTGFSITDPLNAMGTQDFFNPSPLLGLSKFIFSSPNPLIVATDRCCDTWPCIAESIY
jgi:hypothetical protein